jgi:hypothetical protein
MTEKQVTVRVSDRWRVVHDGKPYMKDDTVTVPKTLPRNGNGHAGLSESPKDESSNRAHPSAAARRRGLLLRHHHTSWLDAERFLTMPQ